MSDSAPGAHKGLAPVPLIKRTAAALAVGLIVLAISCDVAYYQFRGSAIRARQEMTCRNIGILSQAVKAYRRENHALPGALRDVLPIPEMYVRTDRSGAPTDGWERRLRYFKDGGRCRIVSYGRDGEPGGTGLDFDLSSDDLEEGWAWEAGSWWPPLPARSAPTFRQFMADRGGTVNHGSGRMMFFMCILTGLVASFLAFEAAGGGQLARRSVRARVKRLLLTTLGTLLVAIIYIIPLHIPSGH